MEITNYITYHMQPLLGLLIGFIIVLLSAFFHYKIDKKVKAELGLPIEKRPMTNYVLKTLSSTGIAVGGIMIIIAIKFLSS